MSEARLLKAKDWWQNESARLEFKTALETKGVILAIQVWKDHAQIDASHLVTVPVGASLAEFNLQRAGFLAGYAQAIKDFLDLDGEPPKPLPPPKEPWNHINLQTEEPK